MKSLILSSFLCFILIGCGSDKKGSDPLSLEGKWISSEVEGLTVDELRTAASANVIDGIVDSVKLDINTRYVLVVDSKTISLTEFVGSTPQNKIYNYNLIEDEVNQRPRYDSTTLDSYSLNLDSEKRLFTDTELTESLDGELTIVEHTKKSLILIMMVQDLPVKVKFKRVEAK